MKKKKINLILSVALTGSMFFSGCGIAPETVSTTLEAVTDASMTSVTDETAAETELSETTVEEATEGTIAGATTDDQSSIDASIAESSAEQASIDESIAESSYIQASIDESIAESSYIAASESIDASIAAAAAEAAAAAAATTVDAATAELTAQLNAAMAVDKAYWSQFIDPKTIYLTFDDGPSVHTPEILDILDTYGVKATFFVTYQPQYEQYYRDIVNRGHKLAVHTATHQYDTIYSSFENWQTDFLTVYNYIYQVTGIYPTLYRFPGGSCCSQIKSHPALKLQIINYLDSLGVEYYDWNVTNGDGEGNFDAATTIAYATEKIASRHHPVVLMHDSYSREVTVLCLPTILTMYIQMGYSFSLIDANTAPIHQGPAWDY